MLPSMGAIMIICILKFVYILTQHILLVIVILTMMDAFMIVVKLLMGITLPMNVQPSNSYNVFMMVNTLWKDINFYYALAKLV
jgi:hypothetical protein